MKTIEIKQNEVQFSLYNVLVVLYEYYRCSLPDNISDKFREFIDEFEKSITKDYIPKVDILNYDLIERISFDCPPTTPNTMISFFELLSMLKEESYPKLVELHLNNKKAKYYYSEEDCSYMLCDSTKKGLVFDTYLKDSLTDTKCFEKIIKVVE